MSKGKRIRAKIHRSLREAREAELARQREIDITIQIANLRPEHWLDMPRWWYENPCITQKDLDNIDRYLGVKK